MASSSGGPGKLRGRRFSSMSPKSSGRGYFPNRSEYSGSPIPTSPQAMVDLDSVSFVSNHQAVRLVISSFDARKRDIVQSIGFGGLLSIPDIVYENKSFSLWLMTRMNWYYKYISIAERVHLTITPDHIGSITGLNCSGIDICDDSLETVNEKIEFIKSNLAFLNNDSGIVEAAGNFVQQDLPSMLTKQHVDNFKIAFVIFVMGRFLTPSSDNPDGLTNFWGALQNADEIPSYNWSSYVYANLFDAARLVEWSIPRKITLSRIAGCTLILQLLYLDNIDLGDLNLSHDYLPRWKYFSNESFSAMIRADMAVPTTGSSKSTQFGRIKALRKGSIYGNNGKQVSCNENASASSPLPPLCPSSKNKSPSSQPLSVVPSDQYQTVHSQNHIEIPTIFNTPPSLEPVLDFSTILRNSYQGEVDDKILDELKTYNAKCLEHLCKSYRSLAASIVKENAHIALKLLEGIHRGPSNIHSDGGSEPAASRRRRYKEFLSGSDSSTEGEDNTAHSKFGRARVSRLTLESYSGVDNLSPASKNDVNLIQGASVSAPNQSQLLKPDVPSAKNSNLSIRGNSTGLSLADKGGKSKNYAINPDHEPTDAIVGCKDSMYSLDTNLTESPLRDGCKRYVDNRSFDTPDATLKMSFLTPNVSPTSENMVFSGACLSTRMLDSMIGIDLNACSFEEEYNYATQPKKTCRPVPFCLSHWTLNLKHPAIDPVVNKQFLAGLASTATHDLNRDWVVHTIPRSIKLSGHELKEQFSFKNHMSFELMDLCIRRMKQLDQCVYSADLMCRWRHLLESDYSLHVLGSENPVENKSIRYQFVGTECNYNIASCRMFYVPLFVNGIWWCYGWDLKDGVVVIFDPSVRHDRDEVVIKQHFGTIEQLAGSLSCIVQDLFTGWSPQFSFTKHVVFRFSGIPFKREESGLQVLFAIWNFDGNKMAGGFDESKIQKFREYLIYQLFKMDGNTGWSASPYVNVTN